jgi:replicative DNA helicase
MEINANYYERDVLAILATAQDSNRARTVINKLSKDMFASRMNKLAYSAIAELSEENEIIDFTSVYERMSSIDNTENNMLYMADMLGDSTGSEALLTSYAKRVRQAYYLRDAQSRVQQANDLIVNLADITKVGELAGQIDEIFSGLMLETHDKKPVHMKEVAQDYVKRIEEKMSGKADDHIVLSNIPELDSHTGGFNRTDLITIGGMSGTGKTEFAVKLMNHLTKTPGSALIFSLEMSNAQVAERAISSDAMLPVSALRNPERLESNNGWQKMSTAISGLINQDIYMYDQTGLNVKDIQAIARQHKRDHPDLKFIVVDHIGLMELGDSKGRHDLQVGEISKTLKNLAKEMETPVCMLTQLVGKQIMQRPMKDRVPVAQDIKDSSRCEEDSDLILLCHRQQVHDEKAPDIAEIVFGKARHAVRGTRIYFRFIDGHFIATDQSMAFNTMDAYYNEKSQAVKKNF